MLPAYSMRHLARLVLPPSRKVRSCWPMQRASARGNRFPRGMRVRSGHDRRLWVKTHAGRVLADLTFWNLEQAKSSCLIRLCRTRGWVRAQQEEWEEEP